MTTGIKDGTQNPGNPSDNSVNNPSNAEKPVTFKSQKDLDAHVNTIIKQRQSKLDTQIADLNKQVQRLTPFEKRFNDSLQTISELQKERDQIELDAAKDNPDVLNEIKLRQHNRSESARLKSENARIEAARAENDALAAQLSKVNRGKEIDSILNEPDYKHLDRNLLDKFGGDTSESLREMAEQLKDYKPASSTTPPKGEGEDNDADAVTNPRPGVPTEGVIPDMSEYDEAAATLEAAKKA